jgi:hypothetical protein
MTETTTTTEQAFDLDSLFDNAGGGTGAPSFEWPKQIDPKNKNRMIPVIGGAVQGEITDIYVTVVKDINTKEPKLDKRGRQQGQVNLTLQTSLRNWESVVNIPTDDDDNELPASEDTGERRIYVKYRLLDAISKAIKESDQASGGPRKGAKLAVKVSDLIYDKDPTRHPLPDYIAKYVPPVSSPADDMFAAEQAKAPAATPPAEDPWATAVSSDEPPF